MKKAIIGVLLLALVLSGCSSSAAPTPEPTILPSDIISAFQDAYGDTDLAKYYRLEYSGGSFYLIGTWADIDESATRAQQGETAAKEQWSAFTEEILSIYTGLRDDLDTYGFQSAPLVGLLASEKDTKKGLLRVEGGMVTYDVAAVKVSPTVPPVPDETPSETHIVIGPTMGEEQALKKALSYLDVSAFSRSGLIDQLIYNKFTKEQAEYAVDHCGADWNEQALKKAQSYLSTSAFSESGLIDQLKYNGFTEDQAMYGVSRTYTDWNEQAAKKAKSYLSISSYSYERLIDQLMYSGFTRSQAIYGANANGYYG